MEPVKDLIRIMFALEHHREISPVVVYVFCALLAAAGVAFIGWACGLFPS